MVQISTPRAGRRGLSVSRAAAALVAALTFFAIASAAIDKNATYQEMLSLAQQMTSLKPQAGSSTQATVAYAAAEARYRDLSAAMGGDDPGHIMIGGGAAAQAAPHTEVVPTTPAGCGQVTATFTQSTPVAIPTGPAVVTSTVVVSGAGPYLFDLDLTTNLTHTFAADLDITLTSPTGKVVTLTTDNGAGNDNVFNGTLWDNDANPAGTVPYTTNNGLATDHAYVNLTTATPLVPEEALDLFIGENPNGTWTITISDDLAGDGGSLDSWSLAVTTFPGPPTTATTTATQSTPVTIPTGPAVVTSTLVVSGAGYSILDVDLTTAITHTFAADLDITLTSPAGTVVTLTTDNGAGNDNVFNGTVWDDDANRGGQVPYTTNNGMVTDHTYVNLTTATPLVPEEAMAAFIGEDPNGTWTITISDDLAGDGGSLDSWSLDIDTFSGPPPCVTGTMIVNGPFTSGGIVTYTYTVTLTNNRGVPQPNVEVVDVLPPRVTLISAPPPCSDSTHCDTVIISGNSVTWIVATLPATSPIMPKANRGTLTITVKSPPCGLMAPAPSLGEIVSNQGSISFDADNDGTNETVGTDDPNTAAPYDPTTFKFNVGTGTCIVDLSLTKTAAPPVVNVGQNVIYTLTVTNNGPFAATGVTVTDAATAGLTYVSNSCGAPNPANPVSDPLIWSVGNLAVSASASCMVTYTVTQAGPIVNTAIATSNENDPTPATGTATVTGLLPSPVGIPTLSEVGLALLFLALAGTALLLLRLRGNKPRSQFQDRGEG